MRPLLQTAWCESAACNAKGRHTDEKAKAKKEWEWQRQQRRCRHGHEQKGRQRRYDDFNKSTFYIARFYLFVALNLAFYFDEQVAHIISFVSISFSLALGLFYVLFGMQISKRVSHTQIHWIMRIRHRNSLIMIVTYRNRCIRRVICCHRQHHRHCQWTVRERIPALPEPIIRLAVCIRHRLQPAVVQVGPNRSPVAAQHHNR